MNNKEKYLHKILDAVVESCSYIGGGRLSITKEDIIKVANKIVIDTIYTLKEGAHEED